jgi:hypothetical protein
LVMLVEKVTTLVGLAAAVAVELVQLEVVL